MSAFLRFVERLGRHRRKPDTDAIARQVFAELSRQPVPEDPTGLISGLTEIGERDCGAITSEPDVRELVDVLVRLPPRQRHALELNLRGLTPPAIAAELGITNEVAIRELAKAMAAVRMETRE
jgi:DNA-directed RNA polymerase specialized sigma24 family protein